jgi:hypothetical protein
MSGGRALLILAAAALVGAGVVVAVAFTSADPPLPTEAVDGGASAGLLPSEVAAPLGDPLVQGLVDQLRQTDLPALEAAVLLAPHARDPEAGAAGALTKAFLGDDAERVLTALFPCRQDCRSVERGALSLAPVCPGGTRWLNDPGRKMARFEACRNEDLLVVRPDGPAGAVVLVREPGLPAIFRALVHGLASSSSGLQGERLDVKALRAAVDVGTGDKRLGQQLATVLDKPLSGKDRRGDAFVLTPVLDEGGAGLCGAKLVVSPGTKMSRRAWPRRYFIDAAVLLVDDMLPPKSFRLASGKDLTLTLEVRAAGCR